MANPLKSYANNKFSQFGEDGIIKRIFEVLPLSQTYWCVEFGAWDGMHLSNTYELVANQNWKGILIEGSPKKFSDLIRTYKNNKRATLINQFISFQGPNTLDKILQQTPIPINFDLLSIDIDGNDYHIWESLKVYQPKVVIIEFNPSIPSDIEFVQQKDFNLNQGNSLRSIIKLGKQKGYELIATTDNNGIFVQKLYFDLFGIPDNNITVLWDTEKPAARVFQLYDGTLVLSERFKLLWHNTYVDPLDLQILPKSMRFYGSSPHKKGIAKMLVRILKFTYLKLRPREKK